MIPITSLLDWIECHPGTAAWVQALGAIVALIVAVMVPVRMARQADRLNQRRFLDSVFSISSEVGECFRNAAARCSAGQNEGLNFVRSVQAFHRFRIVSSAIGAIPLHELPSYEVTQSVLELQAMMEEGLMQLKTAFQEIDRHQALIQAELYGGAFNNLAVRARPHLKRIDAARTKFL
jgi:hypothetical protein